MKRQKGSVLILVVGLIVFVATFSALFLLEQNQPRKPQPNSKISSLSKSDTDSLQTSPSPTIAYVEPLSENRKVNNCKTVTRINKMIISKDFSDIDQYSISKQYKCPISENAFPFPVTLCDGYSTGSEVTVYFIGRNGSEAGVMGLAEYKQGLVNYVSEKGPFKYIGKYYEYGYIKNVWLNPSAQDVFIIHVDQANRAGIVFGVYLGERDKIDKEPLCNLN